MQTGDLRRYYGLDFVTSSLEKKAEAEAIQQKIEQDSIRVAVEIINPDSVENPEKLSRIRSSAAYEIAASAASYVQSQISEDGMFLHDEDDRLKEEDGRSSPRVHKSEMAACVAASAMTAMVAAGEKQKEKAAKDLQSLHSSPCEWFVCDDSSIYTRYFVIQVRINVHA